MWTSLNTNKLKVTLCLTVFWHFLLKTLKFINFENCRRKYQLRDLNRTRLQRPKKLLSFSKFPSHRTRLWCASFCKYFWKRCNSIKIVLLCDFCDSTQALHTCGKIFKNVTPLDLLVQVRNILHLEEEKPRVRNCSRRDKWWKNSKYSWTKLFSLTEKWQLTFQLWWCLVCEEF